MEFPGGRVPFTDQLSFEGGLFAPRPPISCYRTLDSKGSLNSPLAQYSHPYEVHKCAPLITTFGITACTPCAGSNIPGIQVLHALSEELALRMYTTMVKLQTMDVIFYEAQRQVCASELPIYIAF